MESMTEPVTDPLAEDARAELAAVDTSVPRCRRLSGLPFASDPNGNPGHGHAAGQRPCDGFRSTGD